MTSIFYDLFSDYNPRLKSGINKKRKEPIHVGRRGGRIRAFVMTEYYEYCFQSLQIENKRIPENLFHSSVYNDDLMEMVLSIQKIQKKYELIPVEEVWTQSETRRQIEPYRRELAKQLSNRALNGHDIRLLVAWWWDVDIGIVSRIKKYNATLKHVPFMHTESREIILKPKNSRQKRKREDIVVFVKDENDDRMKKTNPFNELQQLLSSESVFNGNSNSITSVLNYAVEECELTLTSFDI